MTTAFRTTTTARETTAQETTAFRTNTAVRETTVRKTPASRRSRFGRLPRGAPVSIFRFRRTSLLAALALLATLSMAASLPVSAAPDAPDRLSPAELRGVLNKLIRRGGVAVGHNGRVVFSHREGRYIPASIIKLATAMAAFHYLGEDHRFLTEVHRWKNRLYIRGFGDPLLVSEAWRRMAKMLAEKGVFKQPYRRLMLDDSAFAPGQLVDGSTGTLNPYDARLGALVSNFNTVFVQVRGRGRQKTVTSAEPQTPITPIAARLGRRMRRGKHRINLTAWKIAGVKYSGELAQAIFTEAGGRFARKAGRGRVPPSAELLLAYRSSSTLRQLVGGMMKFSNNFIANQLVMAIALQAAGKTPRTGGGTPARRSAKRKPAKLKTGMRLVREFMVRELGISGKHFSLIEGSGISPRNSISLHAMLAVVDAFHPWKELLKTFGGPPRVVPAKTGTLTGVYSLAGFLPAPPGGRRPFVIILNQRAYTRKKVFQALWDAYARRPLSTGPQAVQGVKSR